MSWRATASLILALLEPSVAFVQKLHAVKLIRLHGASKDDVTPLEEAQRPSSNKAAFSVYRCDNFAECRETVVEDTMEIKYRAAASDQVRCLQVEKSYEMISTFVQLSRQPFPYRSC